MINNLFDKLKVYRLRKSAGLHKPVGYVGCFTCGVKHKLSDNNKKRELEVSDFAYKHVGHDVNWSDQVGIAGLMHSNANVNKAEGAVQSFTVTNLHSLATSPTAGWQGAVVDNTSGLYLDAQLFVNLDFANTAPADSKAFIILIYSGLESGVYSYPATGSEGTLTLPSIRTAPQINLKRVGHIAYTTTDAATPGALISVKRAFGWLPPYWGPAGINDSGAALASSGNTVKYRLTYLTVV